MQLPKIVAIVGPTASGKTSAALQVAKECNGELIAADSRTVYKGMDIGTAKPKGDRKAAADVSLEDVQEKGIHEARSISINQLFQEKPLLIEGIPHWGFDLVNPDESFTAADFKDYAERKIEGILSRGKLPILVGGTGLYISAVIDNLLFTDADQNPELRAELKALTNEELLDRLRSVDPDAAETIDSANHRRLVRAVEIVETTGKTLANQQKTGPKKFEVLQIGIHIEREELYERIDDRVDQMIAEGLVDEVRGLRDEYGCDVNAMTGIGYRQICAFLDGYMKLREAIELLKRDSRHYAKRQLTWFRRDERIRWTAFDAVLNVVQEFLK